MKRNILLLSTLLVVAGCASYNTEIYFNKKPAEKGLQADFDTSKLLKFNQGGSVNITNHYILWGLFQKNKVDASSVCHGRASKVKVERRWYQSLLSAITFGIYSPMQTTIYC